MDRSKLNPSPFFNVDWTIIILYICLVLIGWFSIYAAVYNPNHPDILDVTQNYGKQLIWIGVSTILIITILIVDSKFFSFSAYSFYIITLGLLIAVLFFGKLVSGNRAWFEIGSVRIQPAEFAKVATCLALAKYIGVHNPKLNILANQVKCLGILALPMILILLQPDAGSAIVFLSLILVMYREGLPNFYIIFGFSSIFLFIITLLFDPIYVIMGLLVIFGILIWKSAWARKHILSISLGLGMSIALIIGVDYVFDNVLMPHQRDRIELLLGKKLDLKGVGYNVNQSKIAIGSGQLYGKGFLEGTQTRYDFVPEQSTDFIFCTIGEEWGFVGTMTLLVLYGLLLFKIITISERQRSTFSRVYGYGVASIIFFHVFVNIGMTIGLMPVIGIPLPLISYGGSSLFSFTMMIFILVKLDSNRNGLIR